MHNMQVYGEKAAGFSLIELIVTLVVISIMATMAVPGYRVLVQDNRRATSVNEFIAALNYARSEAVKRGVNVTVCKASNNLCVTDGDWSQGWMIFADNNSDGIVNVGSGECLAGNDCILKTHTSMYSGITMKGSANIENRITYNAKGMVGTGTGGNGTLILCDSRGFGDSARAIDITVTGRVRSKHTEDASEASITDCTTFGS